jgi:SAM-dependent methyltransferase
VCNDAVLEFVGRVLGPTQVEGRAVLEVGARDVNGTARTFVEPLRPASYLGVDIIPGPGVDEVLSVDHLLTRFGEDAFDVVICTEVLEHVADWRSAVTALKGVVRPGGAVVLTTRSEGFPYHGYPRDFWRLSVEDLRRIFADFEMRALELDPSSPGVFLHAVKVGGRRVVDLGGVTLYSVVRRRRVVEEPGLGPIATAVRVTPRRVALWLGGWLALARRRLPPRR